jgi:hypothetical protein
MKYIAENSIEITDEMIERWAAAYESGKYLGVAGEVTVGRPRLAVEEVRSVAFKLPVSKINAIDELARQQGETRSEFLRDAVDSILLAAT